MANAFSREMKVAWDELLPKFDDELSMTLLTDVYQTNQTDMARQGDSIWLPDPYIATSNDGADATLNFKETTQMSIPATIDTQKHVALLMTDRELRDALQAQRFGEAAAQKLASDINVKILRTVSEQATIFVKRTGAAAGFDDAAAVATRLDTLGVNPFNRVQVLSPDAYRGYASDLQKNTRSFGDQISNKALRNAYVGEVSGIDHYKLQYGRNLAANVTAGVTATTLAAGVNVYVPTATSTGAGGQVSNVDNRRQLMTFAGTSLTSAMVGSAFTIANVFEVNHITKEVLTTLKTFRILEFVSATTAVVSPPMISAQNGEQAALQYQNCSVSSASGTAAVSFQNTVASFQNPFFVKGAVRLLPGNLKNDTAAGAKVMYGSTKQGIQLRMMEFTDIDTGKTKFRWDVFFGVCLASPEQAGLIQFSQT